MMGLHQYNTKAEQAFPHGYKSHLRISFRMIERKWRRDKSRRFIEKKLNWKFARNFSFVRLWPGWRVAIARGKYGGIQSCYERRLGARYLVQWKRNWWWFCQFEKVFSPLHFNNNSNNFPKMTVYGLNIVWIGSGALFSGKLSCKRGRHIFVGAFVPPHWIHSRWHRACRGARTHTHTHTQWAKSFLFDFHSPLHEFTLNLRFPSIRSLCLSPPDFNPFFLV